MRRFRTRRAPLAAVVTRAGSYGVELHVGEGVSFGMGAGRGDVG